MSAPQPGARDAARRLTFALAAALALLVAACNGGGSGSPSAPAATPSGTGSGSGACATAPTPPSDLPGWDVTSQDPTLFPVLIANTGELTCGRNRVLFTLVDKDNRPVGAPDRTASISVYNLGRDAETPIATADGEFVWAIEGERGIYVAYVDLPEAGLYGAEIVTAQGSAQPERIRLTFQVQASSPLIKVGQPAPASTNPTLDDVGGDVARISTDTNPEPKLYETTPAAALEANEPFLLAFATPKFCQTAQCGPTLDRLKPFVSRYPTVRFINVEPYELEFENGSLQVVLDNQQLVPVEAVGQWGLSSEPWIFVVDREGIVRGSFGLIFSDEELTAALDGVK
ncbi:MAG TPA: hypothetical protein VNL94_00450 [Candidatus Binatia bacterium]|nr:hypothetical protein [Candidatus Binatia bacterium]